MTTTEPVLALNPGLYSASAVSHIGQKYLRNDFMKMKEAEGRPYRIWAY